MIIYHAVGGAWTDVWAAGAQRDLGLSRGVLATVAALVLLFAGTNSLAIDLPGLPK